MQEKYAWIDKSICDVLYDEPLSLHTTMGVGGKARLWVTPHSEQALGHILQGSQRHRLPFFIIGNGSNVVFDDDGFDGVVIHLSPSFFGKKEQQDSANLRVGAGCLISDVIDFCRKRGLGGIEFLAGIPGTVGGAVKMNAGAWGYECGSVIESIKCMDVRGNSIWLNKSQITFRYRETKGIGDYIILEVLFALHEALPAWIARQISLFLEQRKKVHPAGKSCGSVFKNPPEAKAGQIIEQAGLKGYSIGDAYVSDKHANFILNRGNAQTRDIKKLVSFIQHRVAEHCHLSLEPEIEFVGRAGMMADRYARHFDKQLRVAVLMGGTSREALISRRSGAAVAQGLRSAGMLVQEIEHTESYIDDILAFESDVVFIALHGGSGENGDVQAALEAAGILYTGPGPEASRIAIDKIATKRLLEKQGLPIPRYIVLDKNTTDVVTRITEVFSFPIVMKPPTEGSSIGLHIVQDVSGLEKAFQESCALYPVVLCEEFIHGRELTVGIIDMQPLPIVEIIPSSGVYDYECKYTPGKTEYVVPAQIDASVAAEIQVLALQVYQLLGCRGMSRIDILLSHATQKPYVLEVNTIPGFTQTSLLPKAAAAAGISFPELCRRIVVCAVQGCPLAIVSPEKI